MICDVFHKKPEILQGLKKIVDFEKENEEHFKKKEESLKEISRDFRAGWEWFEPRVSPPILKKLVELDLLDIVYKSRSTTEYRLKNLQEAEDLLKLLQKEEKPEVVEDLSVSEDLFNVIEGYDDIKSLFREALRSEKPIHFLLIGNPGTAKSLFLFELAQLPGTFYVVGSRTSGVGLTDVLFDTRPRILLVDELEKINKKDLSVLLSLMETGIVKETVHGKQREIKLNTRVFATCNVRKTLAPELVDRFVELHFKPYSKEQFIHVCRNYLSKRESVPGEVAEYIAEKTYERGGIRLARSVARMAKTKDMVDRVVAILDKYSGGLLNG